MQHELLIISLIIIIIIIIALIAFYILYKTTEKSPSNVTYMDNAVALKSGRCPECLRLNGIETKYVDEIFKRGNYIQCRYCGWSEDIEEVQSDHIHYTQNTKDNIVISDIAEDLADDGELNNSKGVDLTYTK